MPTMPPNVDQLPPEPSTNSPSTFSALMDAFLAALKGFRNQLVSAGAAAYANALEAFDSATAAVGAANTAVSAVGNLKWVSGTNYADGAAVWSPIDRRTYRRLGAGAGTTDPSADLVNWTLISQEPGLRLIATATVVNASPVASINFLNLLTDEHSALVIEIEGLVPNPSSQIAMRVAVGGTVLTALTDYADSNGNNIPDGNITLTQGYTVSSDTSGGLAGKVELNNLRSAQRKHILISGTVLTNDTPAVLRTFIDYRAIRNVGVISGLQIYPMVGGAVFQRGKVRIYAYRPQ